ncbi:hypothetical protein RYH22_004275 [Escherichia coli]|nr:exonuclease [Escherichia coli]EGA3984071.1 exonuclease [Escherichia coli]EHA2032426.1 exonuclease [Escherichia coli]EHV3135657.1 hypothetical protein [Escherichia coli]EIC6511808.1 hypothetical protein [Escherichia coli]
MKMAEEKNQEYAYVFPVKNEAARKRLGFAHGFYWKSDCSQARVLLRANVAMLDVGFEPEDFKKPVRVNFPVVNELPAEGVFDTEFCHLYVPGGEDGKTMVYIDAVKQEADKEKNNVASNTNVNGEDMTEIEESMLLPISAQELPVRWLAQHGKENPVTHVSRDELQALHVARAEELPAVTALAVSHKTGLLDPLEIRDLHKLVRDTDKVFPHPGNSDLGLLTAFFEAYLNADYTDRGLLTKEWCKGNHISRLERKKIQPESAEPLRATRERPRRSEKPTFRTINYEIACALCPGADCHDLRPVVNSAKKLMADGDERWRAWSTSLGITEGIKNWDRKTIFDMVSQAPSHVTTGSAEARREWIENFLIARGVRDPEWAEPLVCVSVPEHEDNLERVRGAGKRLRKLENSDSTFQADNGSGEAEVVEADESKVTSSAEIQDADKLLAAYRGEYVEGISDPNDPKWVKGIQRRDDEDQDQAEAEQDDQHVERNSPDARQNEPDTEQNEQGALQGPEKVCDTCGQDGGGKCPDCGSVMGDSTYSAVYGGDREESAYVAEHGALNNQSKVTVGEVMEIMKAVKPAVHVDAEGETEEINGDQLSLQTENKDDRSSRKASEDVPMFISETVLHKEDCEANMNICELVNMLHQQQEMLKEIRSTQARFMGAIVAMLSVISGGEQVGHE